MSINDKNENEDGNNWQNRTQMLIGDDAVQKLNSAKVVILGLGGVGGYTAEGLSRAGIGKFKIVDYDTITETNKNRQIIALTDTIGRKKTDVVKERIMQINPKAEIECLDIFVSPDNINQIIDGSEDYIIDAVDNITAKIAIVKRAKELDIAVISSMGTGNKLNPFMYKIDDIYKTTVCPIARVMRKELKTRDIDSLTVLYSTEMPKVKSRPPASISYMPPIAGLMISSKVIEDLIK